jgi:hypothetical protein
MQRNRGAAARLLASLALLSAILPQAVAFPFQRRENHEQGFLALVPRQCATYCGWGNKYCCGFGTECITTNGLASCTAANGVNGIFTTTWTETRTFTSTITPVQAAGPPPTDTVCVPQNPGEIECGWVCCGSWQTCAWRGQCLDKPGMGPPIGGGVTQTIVITTNGVVTTQYSAPYRVTSATITGVFTSGVPTGTSEPVTGGGGGGGSSLSPGAIAGIVVGVLFGLGLLMLICFCCIAKGLWNVFFGRKKEKRERSHSRHGSPSAHSRRTRHSGWFGGGGSDSHSHSEKKSSGNKWLGLAALAGTLLALLNLRKDKKKPAKKPRSSGGSYSYYSYSGTGTSPSKSPVYLPEAHCRSLTTIPGSASSRPPRSHHSRRTRTTRVSRSSRH